MFTSLTPLDGRPEYGVPPFAIGGNVNEARVRTTVRRIREDAAHRASNWRSVAENLARPGGQTGTCNSGIGSATNRRRHGLASMRAQRSERP